MWRSPVIVSAAAGEPVTLADAKVHIWVDHSSDDSYIAECISAARAHVEARTATRLVTQTVSIRTDRWSDMARLPIAPVQSVVSVSYTDSDGAAQTLSTDIYEPRLEGLEPQLALKYGQTWPTIRPGSLITINAIVGYGAAGAQPKEVLHAIRILVADMYGHRESYSMTPMVRAEMAAPLEGLLENHKLYLI